MKKFQPVTPRDLVETKKELESKEKVKDDDKKVIAVKPDLPVAIPTVVEPENKRPPLKPELEPATLIKKNILEKELDEITSFDILDSQRKKCTKYWKLTNGKKILEPRHKKRIVRKKAKKGNKVSKSPVGVSEKKKAPEKKQLKSLKQALITRSASQKTGNGRLLAASIEAKAPATPATKPKPKKMRLKIGKAALNLKNWAKANSKDLKAISKASHLPKENGQYSEIWASPAWDTDIT